MNQSSSINFFSLSIIDLSKLRGIGLRDFLDYRDPPDYCLILSPKILQPNEMSCHTPDNYIAQILNNKKSYIASPVGNAQYPIPNAKYGLTNITNTVSGIELSIRDIQIIYINLDEYNDADISATYRIMEKIHVSQFKFHIICLQYTNNKKMPAIKNWTYHPLDKKEYCLKDRMSFHILVNKNNKMSKTDLNTIITKDCCTQGGNIGITIDIPYIADKTLNHLNNCFRKEMFY